MLSEGGMIRLEPQPFTPPVRTLTEIERDDIVRQTIAEGIYRLECKSGNATYRQAWKIAVNILKGMEPKTNKSLNDKQRQISSTSTRPV